MRYFNKVFLVCALMLSIWTAVSAQNYTWSSMPSLGQTIYSPASFTIGDTIYHTGGWKVSVVQIGGYPVPISHALYAFDTRSQTWSQRAPFPGTVTYGASSFSINGRGYVVNGWDSTGSGHGPATTFEYDPGTNTWTAKTPFPGATRYTTACFAVNGKGYVVCGFTPYTNEVYCYDPVADTWTQKANFPGAPRQAMNYMVIGNTAYAGMGNTSDGNGSYFVESDWYKYDDAADSWTRMNPFPGDAASVASSFVINGEGYLAGGLSQTAIYYSHVSTASDRVWKYQPLTDAWTLVGVFPDSARFGGAFGSANGAGFCGMGANNFNDYPLTDKFYRYGPGTAPYSCNLAVHSYVMSNAIYNFQTSGNFSPTALITWDFGDGTYGSGTSVMHNYPLAGHYTITASISDTATGCSNSATDTVNVTGINNCSASINRTRYGSLYSLSASVVNGVGPYTYHWSCSTDSNYISTDPNPLVNVAVNTPTTYCVSVTDVSGCVATACTTINDTQFVYSVCQIFVAVYADPYTPGSYSAILYTTGSNNLTYLWDFGDGTTSNLEFPTHNYATPGRYTVCLTASDGAGCSFTFCDSSFYAYKYGGGPMSSFGVTGQVTLGVKDVNTAMTAIYPNPTADILNINVGGKKIDEIVVYNTVGQKVMTITVPAQNAIHVDNLPDGTYMAEVKVNQSVARVKFAKVSK